MKWTICESEHYSLIGEYESADLLLKENNKYIACVGHFYGDPADGLIDKNERFCVTVGCGYIVYYLKDPFESYMYDEQTTQWYESGRDPENINWLKGVRQISDNQVELIDEDDNTEIITIPL